MVSPVDLFWIKIALAAAVLTVGLFGALLPWALGARGASERTLALGDTFAGGVLGGAGLIHLLSGGLDEFQATLPAVAYALALLVAGVGFLLILLLEGVIVLGHPEAEAHAGHGRASARHEIGWPPRAEARRTLYPLILLVVPSVHSIILSGWRWEPRARLPTP